MAERFTYTGQSTLGYFAFADTDTGEMLVAGPGGTYGIRAVEQGVTVPPGDGRWAPASATPLPPPAPKPAITVPASVPGGDH